MLILSALAWAAHATQVVFNGFDDSFVAAEVPTHTIIDILSENPEFSTVLTLIQAHGLVPTINSAFNATLLAPVNSAFINTRPEDVTRNELLYLLVNDTIILGDDHDTQVVAQTFYVHNGFGVQVQLSNTIINHGQSEIVERNLLGSPHRGVVQGISQLLTVPQELCVEAMERDDISIFSQMIGLGDSCRSLGDNVTMFIPNNHAMNSHFTSIELLYLFSGASTTDRYNVLHRHTMDGYVDPKNPPESIKMKDGSTWELDHGSLLLNHTYSPTDTYMCASNGIFNIYKSVLGSPISFTPEKYILALRGYSFVRALNLYGYHKLIDGSNTESQTILVPLNSPQINSKSDLSESSLDGGLFRGVGDNDDILYQFFDQFSFNKSSHLLNTRMPLKSGKYPQRASLYNSESGKHYINWQQVTSESYKIGNTTIMTIDGNLSPPARLQLAIGPLLTSSYALGYLDQLDLLQLPHEHSWTLLLPTREAWDRMILHKYYFDSHREALRSLVNSYIFRTPLYSDSPPSTVLTIDEKEVQVNFMHTAEGNLKLQVSGMHFDTDASDVLFDNGVVHCVTNLELPQSIEISARDLIQSGGRSLFTDLLAKVKLDFILEASSGNYTIIVPSNKALEKLNYTIDTPEPELERMIKLHIIEENPLDRIKSGDVLDSMSGEPLQFEEAFPNVYSISLVSGVGQRVFATGWGNTNGHSAGGSTVVFIDSLISPDWIPPPFIRPPFRLKSHTLLLIGIVLGLVITGLIGLAAVYIFIDDKVLESQPLLTPSNVEPIVQEEEQAFQGTRPISATHVAQGREYGQHLDLP